MTSAGLFAQKPIAVRVIIIIAGIVLTWSSFQFANGQIRADADPVSALAFAPTNAVANAFHADQLLMAPGDKKPYALIAAKARLAVTEQPLNPRALRVLGYVAMATNAETKGAMLIAAAERQSRRDFGTQLWYIEDAVTKDDVAGALKHYDIALRTSQRGRDVLFPILLNALEDANVQKGFVRYVKAKPIWLHPFMSYAIGENSQPAALASLVKQAGGLPAGAVFRTFEFQLLGSLATKGTADQIVEYFSTLPRAKARVLTSAALDAQTTDARFAPVTWELLVAPEVGAQIRNDLPNGQVAMLIIAQPGQSAVVANKLLFLRPGQYSLKTTHSFSELAARPALSFEMRCRGDQSGTIIGQILANSISNTTSGSVTFSVGANCQAQTLSIRAVGGQSQQDVEISITQILLSPLKDS
jgi:hypothetical protein